MFELIKKEEMERDERMKMEGGIKEGLEMMMEEGREVEEIEKNMLKKKKNVEVIWGKGKKGGDGYVEEKYIMEEGYEEVCLEEEKKSKGKEEMSE